MRRYYAQEWDISSLIQNVRRSSDTQNSLKNIIDLAKSYVNATFGIDDDTYLFIICLLDTKSRINLLLAKSTVAQNEIKLFIKNERISKLLRAYGDKKARMCTRFPGFCRLVQHYVDNACEDQAEIKRCLHHIIKLD